MGKEFGGGELYFKGAPWKVTLDRGSIESMSREKEYASHRLRMMFRTLLLQLCLTPLMALPLACGCDISTRTQCETCRSTRSSTVAGLTKPKSSSGSPLDCLDHGSPCLQALIHLGGHYHGSLLGPCCLQAYRIRILRLPAHADHATDARAVLKPDSRCHVAPRLLGEGNTLATSSGPSDFYVFALMSTCA